MRTRQISYLPAEYGYVQTDDVVRRASQTIAINAQSPEERLEFLEMLGLVEPATPAPKRIGIQRKTKQIGPLMKKVLAVFSDGERFCESEVVELIQGHQANIHRALNSLEMEGYLVSEMERGNSTELKRKLRRYYSLANKEE